MQIRNIFRSNELSLLLGARVNSSNVKESIIWNVLKNLFVIVYKLCRNISNISSLIIKSIKILVLNYYTCI